MNWNVIKALLTLLMAWLSSAPTSKPPIERKEPRIDNSMGREAGDE